MCECWQECEVTRCKKCKSRHVEYRHRRSDVQDVHGKLCWDEYRCSTCSHTWSES